TWSRFQAETEVSCGQRQIFDEAGEFGLRDGFYLPLLQADGSMHGVSMMVQHRLEDEPRTLSALHLLAIYYSVAATPLGGAPCEALPADGAKPVLTKRQAECLQWIRAGLSPGAISDKLKISEHTVNEHLEQARRRLHVHTTSQAVIEAINRGLIHL